MDRACGVHVAYTERTCMQHIICMERICNMLATCLQQPRPPACCGARVRALPAHECTQRMRAHVQQPLWCTARVVSSADFREDLVQRDRALGECNEVERHLGEAHGAGAQQREEVRTRRTGGVVPIDRVAGLVELAQPTFVR